MHAAILQVFYRLRERLPLRDYPAIADGHELPSVLTLKLFVLHFFGVVGEVLRRGTTSLNRLRTNRDRFVSPLARSISAYSSGSSVTHTRSDLTMIICMHTRRINTYGIFTLW